MNHQTVMRVTAVISALFGVALLFAPNTLMAIYQSPLLNGTGIYNSMGYGAALLGLAVMTWNASTETLQGARHIILGTLVFLVLALIGSLVRQMTDPTLPVTAWGNVVLFAVLIFFYARMQMAIRAGGAMPNASAA